jgi:hypothetical protein
MLEEETTMLELERELDRELMRELVSGLVAEAKMKELFGMVTKTRYNHNLV